jgi:hypothetical protein
MATAVAFYTIPRAGDTDKKVDPFLRGMAQLAEQENYHFFNLSDDASAQSKLHISSAANQQKETCP